MKLDLSVRAMIGERRPAEGLNMRMLQSTGDRCEILKESRESGRENVGHFRDESSRV